MKSTLLAAHAAKEEEGGGTREWLQKDKAKETTPTGFQSNLELRLGISLSTANCNNTYNNSKESKDTSSSTSSVEPRAGPNPSKFMTTTLDGLVLNGFVPSPKGTKRWFTEPNCSGFIHPWSLAARQQKAVFEQAHQRSNTCSTPSVSRFTPPAPPSIVGWPPVRASRRNLVSPTKPEMDREKNAKKAKMSEDGEKKSLHDQVSPATMFVKVNMEGFAVGRKINLKAHDSYDSLSRALQKMFANFLSTTYFAQEERDEDHNSDYILLYEDHEGDRMLVGDVPWELFITSVKRLYIAHSTKTLKNDDEKVTDDQS